MNPQDNSNCRREQHFQGRTETEEDDEKETKETSHKTPIFVLNRDTEKAAAKKAASLKLRRAAPNYKLPSPSLLREGERGQKLDGKRAETAGARD